MKYSKTPSFNYSSTKDELTIGKTRPNAVMSFFTLFRLFCYLCYYVNSSGNRLTAFIPYAQFQQKYLNEKSKTTNNKSNYANKTRDYVTLELDVNSHNRELQKREH
jgi:hypothetical protein